MTCRYQGRGNPRAIPGRHEPDCAEAARAALRGDR